MGQRDPVHTVHLQTREPNNVASGLCECTVCGTSRVYGGIRTAVPKSTGKKGSTQA